MTRIVDANVLIAAADRNERDHIACAAVLRQSQRELVIPGLCIAEACHLIERKLGAKAEAVFVTSLTRLNVQWPEVEDWERIAELIVRYETLALGGTDASIIALAERLDCDIILTLDRRHFSVVRPRHREHFILFPD